MFAGGRTKPVSGLSSVNFGHDRTRTGAPVEPWPPYRQASGEQRMSPTQRRFSAPGTMAVEPLDLMYRESGGAGPGAAWRGRKRQPSNSARISLQQPRLVRCARTHHSPPPAWDARPFNTLYAANQRMTTPTSGKSSPHAPFQHSIQTDDNYSPCAVASTRRRCALHPPAPPPCPEMTSPGSSFPQGLTISKWRGTVAHACAISIQPRAVSTTEQPQTEK